MSDQKVTAAVQTLEELRRKFAELHEVSALLRSIGGVELLVSDETVIRQIRGQDALDPNAAFRIRMEIW